MIALLAMALPAESAARAPQDPPKTNSQGERQAGAAVDLKKIREAAEREPAIDLSPERFRFYTQITAHQFDLKKILGEDYDLVFGPTRGGAAMTHQEFLDMVTPKEMYGSGGIRATEMLQWSIVNAVGHAVIRNLLQELKNARNEREAREIRERIDRELEALRRRGGGDGERR